MIVDGLTRLTQTFSDAWDTDRPADDSVLYSVLEPVAIAAIPELGTLLRDGVPAYAWDSTDTEPWDSAPRLTARAARRMLPPPEFPA
jgi:hypothetical protein